MAINAIVDGVTYSGVDTIKTGGKVIGLSVDAGANYGPALIEGTVTEISDPSVTAIRNYACYSMQSLTSVDLENALIIGEDAFRSCTNLANVRVPSVSQIGSSAFLDCQHIVTIDLPNALLLEGWCFASCTSLVSVSLPICTSIYACAFYNCQLLVSIYAPNVYDIGFSVYNSGAAFDTCTALATVSFPKASRIFSNCFYACKNLLSLYLMGDSVATLSHSNTFTSTPIGGYTASTGGQLGSIYVPASLLTAYQSATNWAFFSERFVGV